MLVEADQDRHQPVDGEAPEVSLELADTPDVLAFNNAYIAEFEAALAASRNADQLVAAIKQKFPQAGLDPILRLTAARFFPN
jgi:hypothetical protein